MSLPVMDEGVCNNGVAIGSSATIETIVGVAAGSNTQAMFCEFWAEGTNFNQGNNGKAAGQQVIVNLETMLTVQQTYNKLMFLYLYSGSGAIRGSGTVTDTDQRGYAYSLMGLGYDPNYTVYTVHPWGGTSANSGLSESLGPEELLVPGTPVQTASSPTNLSALQSGSIYRREFTNCYYAGQSIGNCAFLVNTSQSSSATVSGLTQTYGYSVTLNGMGIFNGQYGTPNLGDTTNNISFTAGSNPTSLPATGWAILTQYAPTP
jgi:hypothetical protein